METPHPDLAHLSAKEIADLKQYVENWRVAGIEMEKLRRQELRDLDVKKAIGLLRHSADYQSGPRAPKPTTGLIEQQFWFSKARSRG